MATAEMQQHIAQIKQHVATISQDSILEQLNITQAKRDKLFATIAKDTSTIKKYMSKKERDARMEAGLLEFYQIEKEVLDSMLHSPKAKIYGTKEETTRVLKDLIGKNREKLDSIKNNIRHSVKSSNSIYTLGDVYYEGELIKTGDSLPIYIVNGKELTEADYKRVPKDKVKSVNVLKGPKGNRQIWRKREKRSFRY